MRVWHEGFKSAGRMALLIMALVSMSLQAEIEPAPNYSIKITPPDAELTLLFDSPPVYQVRETAQGQVIEFDRPLELPDMTQLNQRLADWIQNISASYDALLVKVQPGVTIGITLTENNLHILFRGTEVKEVPVVEPAKNSLALDRVDALLMLESGRATEARSRLQALITKYPEASSLLLDLARVEETLGNWRGALDLYERAEILMPESTIIKLAKARLLRRYGSRLSIEGSYSEVGKHSEQRTGRAGIRALQDSGNVWLLDFELRDLTEDVGIRHAKGNISPLDEQRQSMSLALETALNTGQQTISVFAGAKDAGLGWAYERVGDNGRSGFTFEWGKPWYETAEALAGYGYRHQLALFYSNTLRHKVSVFGEISVNEYGLDEVEQAAKSTRLQLYFRYWAEHSGSGFSVGYALDWEDVYDVVERMDSGGTVFKPLPLENRELHIIDAGWNHKLSKAWVTEIRLGYENDEQRDANAPYGRLGITYQPDTAFEAGLSLQSGLSTYRGNEDEFYSVSGNVSWFF